jgi:hypothetical protein
MTLFGATAPPKKKWFQQIVLWPNLSTTAQNYGQRRTKIKAKGRFCSKMEQIYLQQPVKYFATDAPHVSTIPQVKTLRSRFEDHKPAVGMSVCDN